MLFTHLELKNWRNFRAADIKLQDRVFIIGSNASGKSNLLDVFRFLRDLVKPGGGLQHAFEKRGGLSKVRCLAARRFPQVEIAVEAVEGPATWKYELGVKQEQGRQRRPVVAHERVSLNGNRLFERPNSDDTADQERLSQTHLEQINANSEFRPLVKFFEQVRYLHLVPQLLRHPGLSPGTEQPEDPFGRNFMEAIARSPQKTRDSRLRRIEGALKAVVPQLKQLKMDKDELGIPHLEAIYEHWRGNGARQREDQFSDGTLRLIGLLWSLLEGDAPLLLEEPELSLHTEIVRRIPNILALVQRKGKRQILVSTHSTEMLSDPGIGGEEVVWLLPGNEGTEAVQLNSRPDLVAKLKSGLTVADAILPYTAPQRADQLSLALSHL
ncbi:MAG: AAA family ATPase [Acidobacteria bacterium]|nr:AAA family ATPase [Acidobacteriota bacterium]